MYFGYTDESIIAGLIMVAKVAAGFVAVLLLFLAHDALVRWLHADDEDEGGEE